MNPPSAPTGFAADEHSLHDPTVQAQTVVADPRQRRQILIAMCVGLVAVIVIVLLLMGRL